MMKRTMLVCCLTFGFWSAAQVSPRDPYVRDPYVGVGLTLYQLESTLEGDTYPSLAGFVQGGAKVADTLELRASVDALIVLLLDTTFAADVLYTVPLRERLELIWAWGQTS